MRGKGFSGGVSKRIVSSRCARQVSKTEEKQRTTLTRGERAGAVQVEDFERRVMADPVGDEGRR